MEKETMKSEVVDSNRPGRHIRNVEQGQWDSYAKTEKKS